MIQEHDASCMLGSVVYAPSRPATATSVWIEVRGRATLALRDLVIIDSPRQAVLGIVVEMERVDESSASRRSSMPGRVVTYAKLELVSASDMRQRPPEGTIARLPRPDQVADLLAEARQIPPEQRVPIGVIPVRQEFAPVTLDLRRLVGPIATSLLITGAAGSYKSTGGMLVALGVQQVAKRQVGLIIVNSKGNDFLFAEFSRQTWADRAELPPLQPRDLAMYQALGYAEPPVLRDVQVFVPATTAREWRSVRPIEFPQTFSYGLSREIAIRYAAMPTDDDERSSSVITRQCIEEVAGPFAEECGAQTLHELVAALEDEFVDLSERGRWRNQFMATTVGAALRQLRAALRDLGPLLGKTSMASVFPVQQLVRGGTWVVDVAPLPQRAAQAVYDALVNELWQAKTQGIIPHDLPLVLLCDELNRFTTAGPTASKLAAIVRDQRHRRFALLGLAQELSTLHPHMLQSADARWIGTTRSQELSHDVYNHLPWYIRNQLHRLGLGQRVLDAWPLAQPLVVEIPFPSWLVADEGLAVVEAWRSR